MRATSETYYSLVILDRASDTIIGVGSLFVERKFLRGLARASHIEDIAVDKQQQGKKIGLRIINALTYISESIGCYKTILNCSESNIREWCLFETLIQWLIIGTTPAFYEKCGFVKKEAEMVRASCSKSVLGLISCLRQSTRRLDPLIPGYNPCPPTFS